MNKDFLKDLREERTSYKDMIDFCCDDYILNNDLMTQLQTADFYFDLYCGTDYIEEEDYFLDIYQWFIIDEQAAERLAEFTNEIVYYCEKLGLYLLGVTHCGTSWTCVDANWKELDEIEDDE